MKVSFYAGLREIVGCKRVEIPLPPGASVAELVDEIARRWPPLREHLLTEEGALSRRVRIFVDGRGVSSLEEGLATPLSDAREVDVFPPVAGGVAAGAHDSPPLRRERLRNPTRTRPGSGTRRCASRDPGHA